MTEMDFTWRLDQDVTPPDTKRTLNITRLWYLDKRTVMFISSLRHPSSSAAEVLMELFMSLSRHFHWFFLFNGFPRQTPEDSVSQHSNSKVCFPKKRGGNHTTGWRFPDRCSGLWSKWPHGVKDHIISWCVVQETFIFYSITEET